MSGQLDALKHLDIYWCNELQSLDSLRHLLLLEILELEACERLTSLPGVLGGYSALRRLTIKYCPAIDMKALYERHQQRLASLEEKDMSHAHSSDEGPKLKSPKSWKYVIPGCRPPRCIPGRTYIESADRAWMVTWKPVAVCGWRKRH